MSKLTDPKVNGKYPFVYTPAASTDLKKTFERIRSAGQGAAASQSWSVQATKTATLIGRKK